MREMVRPARSRPTRARTDGDGNRLGTDGRLVVVEYVLGSIRVTVSSPASATQIASAPYAIPFGRRPTLIVRTGPSSNVAGLKRWTVASPELATHTAPSPNDDADGLEPTSVNPETRPSVGPIRAIVESPNTAHTEPAPAATPPGPGRTMSGSRRSSTSRCRTVDRRGRRSRAGRVRPRPRRLPRRSPSASARRVTPCRRWCAAAESTFASVRSSRFPTQREPVSGSDRPRTDPDRDLGDDLVRRRIDDSDVIRLDSAQAADRIPRRQEQRRRRPRQEAHCRQRQRHGATPEWAGESLPRRPRELRLMTDRREVGRQPVGPGLVEADRAIEVLEPLLAEVAEEDVESSSSSSSRVCVAWETRICPPCPAAPIRAARWTARPVYRPSDATAWPCVAPSAP